MLAQKTEVYKWWDTRLWTNVSQSYHGAENETQGAKGRKGATEELNKKCVVDEVR